VRPGITDPASVRWRNESEELAQAADPEAHYVEVLLPQKAAMYAEYVRTSSFWGDVLVGPRLPWVATNRLSAD
jgi:lipopolysaccharide/colanic/teichoic acid biosynthesis glycosyltransferase